MIKRAGLAIILILVVLVGVGWGLLFTGQGFRALTGLVSIASGGTILIGSGAGRVLGDWQVRDVLISSRSADVSIGMISCEWQPRRLREGQLHIADISVDDLTVVIKNERSAREGGDKPLILPAVALPISFLVGHLSIDTITVVEDTGTSLLEARTLSTRLMGKGNDLELRDLRLDAPSMGLTGNGRVTMSGAWPLSVDADWWGRIDGCTKYSGSFAGSGTLEDMRLQITLAEPDTLLVDADIHDVLTDISYRVSASGAQLGASSFCTDASGTFEDVLIEVSGSLESYRGSGRATAIVDGALPVRAQIDFNGDRQQVGIDSAELRSGTNLIDGTGSLNFGSGLGWNATLRTHSFDLSELLSVPEVLIDGSLNVYGSVDGEQISYDADLQELGVTIHEHNLQIDGGVALHGDQHGLEITQSNFVCGEGTFGVQGNVDWQDHLSWEAGVLMDSFDPAVIELLPRGRISGALTSSGSMEGGLLHLHAEIASLSGELGGYELAGEGQIVYSDETLTIRDLNITNGNNSFQARGDINSAFDLMFLVNGSELERIFPSLSGSITVRGAVSGARHEPQLEVRVDGEGLAYEDHEIKTVQAEAVVDIVGQEVKAKLDLGRLSSGVLQADRLSVDLGGSPGSHKLSGVLQLPRTEISLDTAGHLSGNRWHGEIRNLAVTDEIYGEWLSHDPVTLDIAGELGVSGSGCVSSGENGICVEATWENGDWYVAATDVRFDLGSLNRWGVLEKPLSGIVAGEVTAGGMNTHVASLSGRAEAEVVQWEPGPNRYHDDFTWYDSACSLELVEEDLKIELSTRFVDDSSLSGEIGLIDVIDFTAVDGLGLEGRIDLDIKDLGPLAVVTGEFIVPDGHVIGVVEVSGTVGSPLLKGDLSIHDGGLNIPLLGVDLADVRGTVELDGTQLELDLNSRAGEGVFSSSGDFNFGGQDWSGLLSLTGTNSRLLERRALRVDANPDLELKLGSEGGTLSGQVRILDALAEVERINRSATESSDVVFVDKVEESAPWPFSYNIDVSLGNDVKVEGFGLSAKLGGDLKVTSTSDGTTVGRGYLFVSEGSFVLYGNPLSITRGRLSFDGGPVDNPGLDISASKIIDESRGGFEQVEVGANVIGSAADFEIELFSVPAMEKSDILTYILLDNPFSSEGDGGPGGLISSAAQVLGMKKGSQLLGDVNALLPLDEIRIEGEVDKQETSLVVGKNLSKELSVSYDYNLFNSVGSFRVRYEFGKGFSVESRNSFESNAVELLYSFER